MSENTATEHMMRLEAAIERLTAERDDWKQTAETCAKFTEIAERERCAAIAEQRASNLISGKKRTNEIDRHTAYVLQSLATALRELS